jgi:integrase
VHEVRVAIRKALRDAVRRNLIVRKRRARRPRASAAAGGPQPLRAWNAQQLLAFLKTAATVRVFPAYWVAATTGVRRSDLPGLRWHDIDLDASTMSINRALVSVAYELHETVGKTRNSRRSIDLDPRTVDVVRSWRDRLIAERGVSPKTTTSSPLSTDRRSSPTTCTTSTTHTRHCC